MSIANSTVWEVRTGGADANGGGFHWDSPLVPLVGPTVSVNSNFGGSVPHGVVVSAYVTFQDAFGAFTVGSPVSSPLTVSGSTFTNKLAISQPTNPSGSLQSWGFYVSAGTSGPYWLYTQGISLATSTFNFNSIPPIPPTSLLSAPTALACTPSGTGGSMTAGSWYFTAAYIDGSGNYSAVGPATLATTSGSTSSVSITPPTQGSAVAWTLYGGSLPNGPFWTVTSEITNFSSTVVNQFNPNGSTLQQGRGTDYSQQTSPQLALTDIVTTSGSQFITSVTGGFTSAMVGNIIQLNGTVAGFYEVIAQVNSNTAVLDRTLGASATGVTGNLGGALTLYGASQTQSTGGSTGNKVFVQGGAYNLSSGGNDDAGFTFSNPNVTPSNNPNGQPFVIEGYNSTRGDLGLGVSNADDRPVITLNASTGASNPSVFHFANSGVYVKNLIINCSSVAGSTGINIPFSQCHVENCKISNFGSAGINCTSGGTSTLIMSCELTGGLSAAHGGVYSTSQFPIVVFCNIHGNSCPGIATPGIIALFNLIYANSGAGIDGYVQTGGNQAVFLFNTIDSNGRYGINMSSNSSNLGTLIKNNVISNNGSQGWAFGSSPGIPFGFWCDNNAYYDNNSSTVYASQITFPSNLQGVAQQGAWTSNDKNLIASPFVSGSAVYTLNNTPNGGQSCRGTAVPTAYPGNAGANSEDIGAFHISPTSVGSLVGISVSRLVGGI